MILFIVAGFGYGNASRQLAVIKELRAKDPTLPITVFSWGNGANFFQQEAKNLGLQLRHLVNLRFNSKGSYLSSFVLSAISYALQYPLNILLLFIWRLKNKPLIIIFDSDYHFPAFFLSRARRIAINQAPRIILKSQHYSFRYLFENGYLFSYLIEFIDYGVQLLFAHSVLVPDFLSADPQYRWKKVLSIPLIVRREFLESEGLTAPGKKNPALVLGGSGIESRELKEWAQENHISIFEKKSLSSDDFDFIHRLKNFSPLIVQGGLSSISEGIAMRKSLLIVPVKHHWEQFLNALECEERMLGQKVELSELNTALESNLLKKKAASTTDCSGAHFVCHYLLKEMSHES